MIDIVELKADIRSEGGSYWAEISELPGCFAAGDSLDELFESLREGVRVYLSDDQMAVSSDGLQVVSAVLSDAAHV